ncbi:ATP-binding protein [Paraburkholderia sp. BL25I1N1]|uniref:ATP-binding protein n=1 Tax=Paraburkholderia sp. BL25I1N1 TaxID=1938804 RepID=UPI000D06648C|nr:ATP-binding protein [Paraburkholderia sp. BL25I1N1]PRY05855.1 two-component system capsular synthesis sensor histidine kinase RcsC [Paraburkholderia sp. BL25I1N1]
MQKILDRTQESLAQAFATLAQSAKRQQRLYLATIGSLMLLVLIFALVLTVVAGLKQLEYRRVLASQNATDISLLIHQEESFLRRDALTLDYYYGPSGGRSAPDAIQQAILKTGVALGKTDGVDSNFDIVVGETTRNAWGSQLSEKLGRLYEAAQSTLVTQQAFEIRQRATLIGLNEDYAAILPSLTHPLADPASGHDQAAMPAPQPPIVSLLRETLERQIEAQTGRRVPAKGERIWLGPYRDPLQNRQVVSVVSAYYDGDTPTVLISTSLPLDALALRMAPPDHEGVNLLMTADHRVVVSSMPLDASIIKLVQQAAAATPTRIFHYGREGVIFHEPLGLGFGLLVGYVPWGALAAALGWQLTVLGCLTALILIAIVLTARYFGLRLLRNSFAETSRALQSEMLNHILVSATPVGLCIVRQSDYSVLTTNALAIELLGIEADGSRLPRHIVGEFLVQAPDQPSAMSFARVAAFVVPARPVQISPQMPPQSSHPSTTTQRNEPQTSPPPDQDGGASSRFLQFIYAPARYAGENVLFCAILDVTAQTMLEQQLRQAQQTSEALMRARTNFFAAMSHEIRTPLNALLGNLELLARTPGLEAHSQRLATLGLAGGALRRVVNDILDFSKIDAGAMLLVTEPFCLIDDFESIALSYAPMHGNRSIRFYAIFSPTLEQTLIGDRMRIAQIVNNLLSNAFKFTSAGKITLRAEVTDDSPDRAVLVCRVSDSGAGMDEQTLARLFKPFAQGEQSASRGADGTGLGLVICARLCALMGGQITAESVSGVGSAFRISIPLAKPPIDSRAPATVREEHGTMLILSVEQEVGENLNCWFQREGWARHLVFSSAAAQAWLRANRPDVLVVTGEYDLDVIAALRALQPVGVVWITRGGPHHPEARGDGVFEVTEFSRSAIRSAVDLARGDTIAVAAPTPASAMGDSAGIYPALRGLPVLVAEDNPLIQNLIDEQLVELGCAPTIAHDGKEALRMFQQGSFEVVLTDIHMPEMDGYELLAALRKLNATVQVLAFSAVAEHEEARNWREHGFSGYVPKPASLSELQAALLAVAPAPAGAQASAPAVPENLAPAEPMVPASSAASTLSTDDRARYRAMLKEHLQKDLPRLLAIVEAEDVQALAGWAHSASGAFVVVQEPLFVDQCRRLQRLCSDSGRWTTEMDELAISLHDALSDHYGLDEESTH